MASAEHLFSIITIVNKENLYQQFKQSLAQQQDVNYELIKINNDHQQFDSARAAFNAAAKKAHGDYLVFLHPDIRFLDDHALHDVLAQILQLPNLGVAGVAGSPFELNGRHAFIVTTLVQGLDKSHVGTPIKKPKKVQTIDECFFVMKKTFWEQYPFSDLKGWHMYAVEECLKADIDGYDNYVVPSRVWHRSTGTSENWQYVQTGMQIVQRYGSHFDQINTTVSKWETHGWRKVVYPPLKFAKRQVRRKLNLPN